MSVTELRVHGVGGAPGPKQLGLHSDDETVVLRDYVETRVLARRADHSVQSYEWGDLTSGSGTQASWIFLLPFTLMNVAGWMHPATDHQAGKHHIKAIRICIAALSLMLSAACTLWLIDICVGLLGYEWAGRLAGPDGLQLPGWLGGEVWRGADVQRWGTFLGFGLTIVVGVVILQVAIRSTPAEGPSTPLRQPTRTWADPETLESPTFRERRRPRYGGWRSHALVAMLCWAGSALIVAPDALAGRAVDTLPSDTLLLWLAIAGIALHVVLAVISWVWPAIAERQRRKGDPGGERVALALGRPFAVSVLAFAVVNTAFIATELWLSVLLGRYPTVAGEKDALSLGRAGALVDAFVATSVVWLALAIVLFYSLKRGSRIAPCRDCVTDEVIEPCADPPEPPIRWRGATASAQATARFARQADRLVLPLAAVAIAIPIIQLFRVTTIGDQWILPWTWRLSAPDVDGLGYRIAAWAFPLGIAAFVVWMRRAVSDKGARRVVGQAWDILTFWPRRFHPLAVRSYADRVVPELGRLIEDTVESEGRIVISAHSQGSVLTFAALAPLDDAVLGRVGLITYGSPLGTLFRRSFPGYVNPDAVSALQARLHTWVSFHRPTDPIGGAVFTDPVHEHCLADPIPWVDPPEDRAVPLEPDRLTGEGLAIHSHYLREPLLKATTDLLKDGLEPMDPIVGDDQDIPIDELEVVLPDELLRLVIAAADAADRDPNDVVIAAVRDQMEVLYGDTDVDEPGPSDRRDFRKLHSERNAEVRLRQDDDLSFTLLEAFRWVDPTQGGGRQITVPVHNKTDLASIPNFLTWLVPRYGRHTLPALLHDHLQHVEDVSSAEADDIFRDSMQQTGVPFIRRWSMWAAVFLRTLVLQSRWWLALIVPWLSFYALGVGVLAWTYALVQATSGNWAPLGVTGLLVFSPVVTAVLWLSHYRVGLISGVALSLLALPIVGVLVALGIYLGAEQLARLTGKGKNPIRTATWRKELARAAVDKAPGTVP